MQKHNNRMKPQQLSRAVATSNRKNKITSSNTNNDDNDELLLEQIYQQKRDNMHAFQASMIK